MGAAFSGAGERQVFYMEWWTGSPIPQRPQPQISRPEQNQCLTHPDAPQAHTAGAPCATPVRHTGSAGPTASTRLCGLWRGYSLAEVTLLWHESGIEPRDPRLQSLVLTTASL